MRKTLLQTIIFSCLFLGLQANATKNQPLTSAPQLLQSSKQLILVITDTWDSSKAELQLFTRNTTHQPWQATGKPFAVVVGKKGLGWAKNFAYYVPDGPIKKEGDLKAPAGVFKILAAFGVAQKPLAHLKLPYIPITASTVCVDDPYSQYYGQFLDSEKTTQKDWNSAEYMSQHPAPYKEGIIVDYNSRGQIQQGGSCIFLHIKTAADQNGTFGCTAMSIRSLEALMTWLDPKNKPVLVQLPKEAYRALQSGWNLPHYTHST